MAPLVARSNRALFLLAAAATACAPGDRAAHDTAIVAFNAEMQAFNPLVNTDLNTTEVNNYMLFTPLVQYDSAFQPRPYLASGWELDSAGVTFRLHHDVRWHDGRPVTAHDVAFTFDLANHPETASVLASVFLDRVRSATVLDSFTVRFEFTGPHARPLDGFWWPPVPRHLLENVPPSELVRHEFNRRPVGSGPFRFVDWQPGVSASFERVPDFAESLGGPARIDRILFRFVAEPATLLSETLTGAIDVNGSVFPHQAADVERAPDVRLLHWPSREYYYIGWNVRNPLFADARVRRALTMALDRRELIDVLLFEYAEPATGTIAPWHPMHADIAPTPHAPGRAAVLLDSAGWRDRDGDGIRENPSGAPFRFTLMTNHENPVRTDIAQVAQAALARIGVAAEVRTTEWQTLLARHRAREFDAVVQSWVLDNFRVDPFSLFHSSQAELPGSYNRSGLQDDFVDRTMELALTAADDETARAAWREFSLALQEAQPFTFLMWLDELAAVSTRMSGVEMDARGTLVSVARWVKR